MVKRAETLPALCSSTTKLGNSIAIYALEYFNIASTPVSHSRDLVLNFMETSQALFPVGYGLAKAERAGITFPQDVTEELYSRVKETHATFATIYQVMGKLLENEKKHGIAKGLRKMFAHTNVDEVRHSLVQCRRNLGASVMMLQWAVGGIEYHEDAGIGYTALAAVLNLPNPSKASPPISISPSPRTQHVPTDSVTQPGPQYTYPISPRQDNAEDYSRAALTEYAQCDQYTDYVPSSPQRRETVRVLSEMTSNLSIAGLESMMSQNDVDQLPKEAIRVTVDPSLVPRWTPKNPSVTVSSASRSALLAAIKARDHGMVEQLLDEGNPPSDEVNRHLLQETIHNRDIESLQLLLLFGADPNGTNSQGGSALYVATETSFIEAANILIKYGADATLCPHGKISPLALSLTSSKSHFAALYLQHGACPNAPMADGNTSFIHALNRATPASVIELLILYGADVNGKNSHGETPLFRAIHAERVDLIHILIERGAQVNLPGPKHMLWPAVHHPRVLEVLLSKGADLAKAPGILELAVSINSFPAVDLLLRYGCDPNSKKDGIFTPLCSAIRDDHSALVDILLSVGANPNLQASEYPLWKCITHHRPRFIPRLLAAGADPNVPKGIIDLATEHQDMDALKILLEHKGIDVNARNGAGRTALTSAIKNGSRDIIELLLASGASPEIRGQDWPINMAVRYPDILSLLLPHIALTMLPKGALELAVAADKLESVKLLLAKGADVEEKNGGVFSPLTTSIREDRKEIFSYLIDEAGANVNAPGEHLPIVKAIRRHREDDLSYIEALLRKGANINLVYRGWSGVLQALENGDLKILNLFAELAEPDLDVKDGSGRSIRQFISDRGLFEEESALTGGRPSSATTVITNKHGEMLS